ncbi:hypothetical protein BC830DRAFT_448734 [Chytriomyces sp. MP71]|nr:hypothetical protein BC830DRAFT_448734 [Chytriomyces sp. MP71]
MPNGSLPRTLHELDPTEQEFVDFVDAKGEEVNRVLQGVFPSVFVEEQLKRFSCYAAAEGSNANANLTDARLLHSIDRFSYFSHFNTLLPTLAPTRNPNKKPNSPYRAPKTFRHRRSDGSRRRYKLAYFLMIHGDTALLPGITLLVEELDDCHSPTRERQGPQCRTRLGPRILHNRAGTHIKRPRTHQNFTSQASNAAPSTLRRV